VPSGDTEKSSSFDPTRVFRAGRFAGRRLGRYAAPNESFVPVVQSSLEPHNGLGRAEHAKADRRASFESRLLYAAV